MLTSRIEDFIVKVLCLMVGVTALLAAGCDTEAADAGLPAREQLSTPQFRANSGLDEFCDDWASSPTSSRGVKRFTIEANIANLPRYLGAHEVPPGYGATPVFATSRMTHAAACTDTRPEYVWVAECERDADGNAIYARLRRSLTHQYVVPRSEGEQTLATTRVFNCLHPTAPQLQLGIYPEGLNESGPYSINTSYGPLNVEPERDGKSSVVFGGNPMPGSDDFFLRACPD